MSKVLGLVATTKLEHAKVFRKNLVTIMFSLKSCKWELRRKISKWKRPGPVLNLWIL
jgi:hypothetical protein